MEGWPTVTIKTNYTTGEVSVTYSCTPEELVQYCQRTGERLHVASKACKECPHASASLIPRSLVEEKMNDFLRYHRYQECICGAVARYYRRHDVPSDIVCYGFYYRFWHQNKYLHALTEASLIAWCDVSSLPGLRESGLLLSLPDWQE